MIVVTHNGTDITAHVNTDDFDTTDERNSTRDTLEFTIEKSPGGFTPLLNAEILVTLDGVRIFGGSILSLQTQIIAPPVVVYSVECVDFSHQMDRRLITERFIDEPVNDIIAYLFTTYAPTYTITNVVAPQVIARISFNRLTLSECLDKLAKLNNFNWYVDYYKDLHFFARNEEPAPFDLTDTSNNYVIESLRIRSDLSQLRNIVQVEGGEVPISARTTKHAGDGETTEFPTNFKFSELPTVTVNGVAKTVGTEYLATTTFDCYWSFTEKYVRFDPASIPPAPGSGTTNIEITGTPLVPLVAVVPDETSIAEFGEFEHSLTEPTIRSEDQAIDRGLAELEAYAAELTEASFDTYTPGLRSGQVLSINSTLHGVDATYVIQRVSFRPYPNGSELSGVWSVTLASTATMSLIDALRGLLKPESLADDELQVLLAFYRFSDSAVGSDEVEAPTFTTGPYLWSASDWSFAAWQ